MLNVYKYLSCFPREAILLEWFTRSLWVWLLDQQPLILPRAPSLPGHLQSISDGGTRAANSFSLGEALHPLLQPCAALPVYNLNRVSLPIDNQWPKTHVGMLSNTISLSYLTQINISLPHCFPAVKSFVSRQRLSQAGLRGASSSFSWRWLMPFQTIWLITKLRSAALQTIYNICFASVHCVTFWILFH